MNLLYSIIGHLVILLLLKKYKSILLKFFSFFCFPVFGGPLAISLSILRALS